MIEKYESRRIRVQIRHILLSTWDPIGVRDNPKAQDEYDSYVVRLYELLVGNASDAELIDYLYWVVHELMGLEGATRDDMATTVEALREISLHPIQTDVT
jgi:hypothetical protein